MRRIINSTYISLDGVIENPHLWPALGRSSGGRGDQIQTDLLLSCDAVLMGRRTYDGFAPVWPTRSGDPYSDRINTMPKFVVSATLRDPQWANTHVVTGDIPAEIARLKNAAGNDIVQYGFGQLTRTMLEHGLLDELRLWVHPQIVGAASAEDLLFRPGPPAVFDLTDVTTLSNGLVILTYQTNRPNP
jgi:dihydrofolate reductase